MSNYIDVALNSVAQNVSNTWNTVVGLLGLAFIPIAVAWPDARFLASSIVLCLFALAGLIYYARHNYLQSETYFVLAAARGDTQVQGMLENTVQYFSGNLRIPQADNYGAVSEADGYNEAKWEGITDAVTENLNELRGTYDRIHFASYAPLACSFLLGTKLGNRYPLEVYQYHQNFHPVWNTEESLRNGVTATRTLYTICKEPIQLVNVEEMRACAVALNIGTLDSLSGMQAYAQEKMPDVSFWSISRNGYLASDRPQDWLLAAQEIASGLEKISEVGKFELYLFMRMPSTLALMAGAALSGLNRRIHFMQDKGDTYEKVLEIRT